MTINEPRNLDLEDDTNLSTQRERWIHQHSAFLNAALSGKITPPRIPRRRVDDGGFTDYIRRPGVRALMNNWWTRILEAASFDP